jgi:hypothetical protein
VRDRDVRLEGPGSGPAAQVVTQLEVRQRAHVHDVRAARHLAERAIVSVRHPEAIPAERALSARRPEQLARDAPHEELYGSRVRRLRERDDDARDAARAAIARGEAFFAELAPRALERRARRAVVLEEPEPGVLEKAGLAEATVRLDDASACDLLEVVRVRAGEVEAIPAHVEAGEEALDLDVLALVGCDEDDGLHREPR